MKTSRSYVDLRLAEICRQPAAYGKRTLRRSTPRSWMARVGRFIAKWVRL